MKNENLKPWVRLLLVLCSVGLVLVLFVPLWRIDLVAPQYPEGLKLLIYPGKLGGNVEIINGLNHYIGMKTLHTADFIEFTVLPYIIMFFAAAVLAVAAFGRKKLLYILLALFIVFGIVAMYDFWRWEYNYGHNLNPDAAIIVPGMAYQPPLIGYKQLLNFAAYSIPDMGGWIFIGVGMILLFCTIVTWRSGRQKTSTGKGSAAVIALLILLPFSSCSNKGPEPIRTGTDQCHFCKMTVSDARFGAELITKKNKVYKFDDMHCILAFLKNKEIDSKEIRDIYFTDFCGDHALMNVNGSLLLQSADLRSPMGGNVAAFTNKDSLSIVQKRFPGGLVQWSDINKP
jgi:copper chaperone NosL